MSKKYVKELIEMSEEELNCELENVPVEHFRNLIKIAMKEQDRDTRHACAEAVIQCSDASSLEMIDRCHNACMNAKAI